MRWNSPCKRLQSVCLLTALQGLAPKDQSTREKPGISSLRSITLPRQWNLRLFWTLEMFGLYQLRFKALPSGITSLTTWESATGMCRVTKQLMALQATLFGMLILKSYFGQPRARHSILKWSPRSKDLGVWCLLSLTERLLPSVLPRFMDSHENFVFALKRLLHKTTQNMQFRK